MKKDEIKVGGLYLAKVGGTVTTVRVDAIREDDGYHGDAVTRYDVTNLATGRRTTFRSAAKFRGEAPRVCRKCGAGGAKPRNNTDLMYCDACDAAGAKRFLDAVMSEGEQRPDPMGVVVTAEGPLTGNAVAASTNVSADSASGPGSLDNPFADLSPSDLDTLLRPEQVADRLLLEERTLNTEAQNDARPAGLAARIAATRTGRAPGSPVAGMVPNAEQEDILATAATLKPGEVLVTVAGAGSGKTASCKMLEQTVRGTVQYTAFNRPLVDEARGKFTRARVSTTHSLAFGNTGKRFAHRLPGKGQRRMRSEQIAQILGIGDYTLLLKGQGEPEIGEDGQPTGRNTDKVRTLKAGFLAGQVIAGINRFAQSADRTPGTRHLKPIDGIDAVVDGRPNRENNDAVRAYLLPFLIKAWDDLSTPEGVLPYAHDYYVKAWQLGEGADRPVIAADYILLDEYQDTAPVFLDILMQQRHAVLIMVGDDNQRIYSWRGAVNAGDHFPDAPRCLLSQSYRFGQAVADVANAVLATLEEPTKLRMRGNPAIPSRVAAVAAPRCYLYRTNAGAIARFMSEREAGRRPHLLANAKEVIDFCEAALDLQAIPPRATDHQDLGCFDNWGEVQEYSKSDEGADLRLLVKLVDSFGADAIRAALRNMPKEDDADVVISTAHKSKGREWTTVRLGQDFPTMNKMDDEDRRLLYVALTRAEHVLDITECPPFCGAEVKDQDGGTKWVPGLRITYTQPMPSEADLTAYLAAKASPRTEAPAAPTAPVAAPAPAPQANGNAGPTEFTWANIDGKWRVRGPAGQAPGTWVTVVKRSGEQKRTKIGEVVKKLGDLWFYDVA